jgi:hypothetical protein
LGDGRVRINSAAADELSGSLPGIEPERAMLIVAYREEHGYLRGGTGRGHRPRDGRGAGPLHRLVGTTRAEESAAEGLKRYLEGRYPGSRSRSVLYTLTVGGSLWLIAQSVGGAVEWFVGRGLERVFGL